MAADETPPLRNFARMVQYATPGRILVANSIGSDGNVYPEWSESVASAGQVLAYDGDTFVAMTVAEAASAAGAPLDQVFGSEDDTVDPGVTITVEGTISALPSGQILAPYPAAPDDVATKQYVDDEVQAILSASGGISETMADAKYVSFASGGVMAAHITQPLTPTASGDLANKAYVDSEIQAGISASGGIAEAAADAKYVSLASGGVMAAHITQPLTPTASGHLINKAYFDSHVSDASLISASSNTSLGNASVTVFANSASGAVNIVLPSAHTAGTAITVKDFGLEGEGKTLTNAVTITAGGSGKIDGSLTPVTLTQNSESATFIGNGTNWGRV